MLVTGDRELFLCSSCDVDYFYALSPDDKVDRLIQAMKMAQEKNISLGYALNVLNGRYSLQEARRRQRLKDRERSGKSVDIFVVGRRMPGGYR